MKHIEAMMLGCVVLVAAATISQAKNASQPAEPGATPAQTQPAATDRGQQVFEQNCSRCHNSPEGFSPHISGAIAKHMRVRAGLSNADYKALLRFLNP
jgi:mono/diheme cytochrome c family protein